MSATARERDDVDLAERVELLEANDVLQLALIRALSDRLAELEGVASLDHEAETTIKQAAHTLGHSETTIRRWLASGRIEGRKIGGRVLIKASSLAK